MSDFGFTFGKQAIGRAAFNLVSADIRFILCMTSTTATVNDGTGVDATFISGITLDEFDGGGSHPPSFANRELLLGTEFDADTVNNRAEFSATNHTVSSIPAGTRPIQGIIVYYHVTNDAASIPLVWIDSGGFPFTANGGDLIFSWNAEGIFQLT